MATLKEHQAAMVDLLANGSGIPASASRLAHAMHDVLAVMEGLDAMFSVVDGLHGAKRPDATTPGLNDKALAGDIEACRPKATPAERRVKELENTVKQLRASNAKLRIERDDMTISYQAVMTELRQIKCTHDFTYRSGIAAGHCLKCGISREPEQAGCRKDDTQVCAHDWEQHSIAYHYFNVCTKCGAQQ